MAAKWLSVYRGVVQPWLCDAMGHLTTRHYLAMFDDANYHLFQQVLGYTGSHGDFAGMGFADVKHVIEYRAELPAGELIEIRGRFVSAGGKSFSHQYEMIRLSSGEVAATLEGVTAYFDLGRRRAAPLSQAMRAAIEASIAGN